MEHQTSHTLPDIRKVIQLNAPILKVWHAVSTSEGLSAWFMPNDLQAEVGYEFQLNAGPFGLSPCKVTEVDPPNKLAFEWGKDWVLTFELAEKDGRTELTLIHSGWTVDNATEFGEAHPVVCERMDNGWSGIVRKLGEYVEG